MFGLVTASQIASADCYVTLPGTIVMVFVMVTVASIFFLLADQLMRIAVSFILGA
jgi:hypothetical protein